MQEKMHNAAPVAPSTRAQVAAAAQKLDAGDPSGARALLEPLARTAPGFAEAAHLLAVAYLRLGAPSDAEAHVRRAIGLNPRQSMVHVTLGDVLAALNRRTDAERAYQAALAVDPRLRPALRQLAQHLLDEGRAAEALALLDPVFAGAPTADLGLLSVYAGALKLAGRKNEACIVYRKAVDAAPRSGVAEHNLAALLGDLGRNDEAATAAQRALAKGLNAPETHVVRGRALLALGRNEEAQACLETAVNLRPAYLDAQRELAQLTWMRTEDVDRALEPIERALAVRSLAGLVQLKAGVMSAAGRHGAAAAVLNDALYRHPQDAGLHLSACKAALALGAADRGLELARTAQRLTPPGDPEASRVLCEALLAVGDAEAAATLAERSLERRPDDQVALAYLATAWRMLGDPRYRGLYDYDAFVQAFELEPPPGWTSRTQFVSDVAAALRARHRFKTHPLEQSLRHGSQLPSIFDLKDPVLDAFRQALDAPVGAYMTALGPGEDPMRRRYTGRYHFQGAWSVRLRPGGLHANHIHGEGWISSACYLDLPDAVGRDGSQGCIRFGEPGVSTRPPLSSEHEVTPRAGMVVLFPSYMWHGTVPFEGSQSRLTAAFDIVPIPR
jgi:tetratricopeptide (TPR) repeat protein